LPGGGCGFFLRHPGVGVKVQAGVQRHAKIGEGSQPVAGCAFHGDFGGVGESAASIEHHCLSLSGVDM